MVVDILKIILAKKNSVKSCLFWSKLDFYGKNWSKIGLFFCKKSPKIVSRNRLLKIKPTSSSSKFCADFKNARLFDPRTVTRPENRVFLSQGGKSGFVFSVFSSRFFQIILWRVFYRKIHFIFVTAHNIASDSFEFTWRSTLG